MTSDGADGEAAVATISSRELTHHVGARLRLEVEIISAENSPDSVRAVFRHRFWSSGAKPVCIAEQSIRYTHDQP